MGGFFYSRITLCITVFCVFGAWGGIGLELHAPNKIKTARPTWVCHPTQNPTGQRNPTKKRTKWCVLILVPVVGLEPTTYWLQISRSTSWAKPAMPCNYTYLGAQRKQKNPHLGIFLLCVLCCCFLCLLLQSLCILECGLGSCIGRWFWRETVIHFQMIGIVCSVHDCQGIFDNY